MERDYSADVSETVICTVFPWKATFYLCLCLDLDLFDRHGSSERIGSLLQMGLG